MLKCNIAVILAGGMGVRTGNSTPKQFITVGKMPLLAHAIHTFHQSAPIDKIIIVAPSLHIERVHKIVTDYRLQKVETVIPGGKERYLSTYEALQYCKNENENSNILIHDGVRPLVSQQLILNVLQALENHNAATPAISTTDTILVKSTDNFIVDIPSRERLMSIQTPQGFRLKTIRTAYEKANENADFLPTDDCGMIRYYLPDEKIAIVPGETNNIKVTHSTDFALVEKLLIQIAE